MICIDCEWNRENKLLLLSWYKNSLEYGVLKGNEVTNEFLSWVLTQKLLVGHNIKTDLWIIAYNTGVLLDMPIFDTFIAAEFKTKGINKKDNSLKGLLKLLGVELDKEIRESFLDKFDYEFSKEELEYALNDVKYLPILYKQLNKNLPKAFKVDMECIVPLVSAELRGMKINKTKLKEVTNELKNQRDNLVFQLNDFIINKGYESINFRSSKQLLALFDKLGLVIADRDGKPSVNKNYIKQAIYNYPEYKEFLEILIQLSEMNKLISTYGDGILEKLDNNDIISTYYTINFTNTGRISSKADKLRKNTTNLQNIPARSVQGQLILESFEAREGYILGISDLSGAELRLAADYSKDKVLVNNFNAGGDFHSELATCSWKIMTGDEIPISKKHHPEFRDKHKQVNFGIIYGATHTRIAEVLGIELEMAEKCFEEIKKRVPVLMNYLKKNQIKAKNNGFLIGKLGRIAYKLNATQAANFEIQNANAEAMKIALRKIYNYIKLHKLDAYIVNTVHDSIIIEAREGINLDFIPKLMGESLQELMKEIEGKADLIITKQWKK